MKQKKIKNSILYTLAFIFLGVLIFNLKKISKFEPKKQVSEKAVLEKNKPQFLSWFPVCLHQSEEEKRLDYKVIVLIKEDFSFYEWMGKEYKPLTLLPEKPDKEGRVQLEGNKMKIYFKDGPIKIGEALQYWKDSRIPSLFVVDIGQNKKRTFSHDYCKI